MHINVNAFCGVSEDFLVKGAAKKITDRFEKTFISSNKPRWLRQILHTNRKTTDSFCKK